MHVALQTDVTYQPHSVWLGEPVVVSVHSCSLNVSACVYTAFNAKALEWDQGRSDGGGYRYLYGYTPPKKISPSKLFMG